MASERVIYFSKNTQNIEGSSKKKLERRSTRITNCPPEILSQSFNDFNDEQVFEAGVEAPSPEQSSEQASSVQVKYLSYLARVIDSAPECSDSEQIQSHYHNSEYWQVIYQSAIYVKKCDFRTNIDDNLILSQISQYLIAGRIHPEAKNQLGKQLMRNGYFLSAYAIATGRIRKSPFIFKYLMQYFQNEFEIETNYEEFNYLLENYIEKQRAQSILNLGIESITPGQNRPQNPGSQSPNNHNNRLSQKSNNQQLIRRPFLVLPNDQESQDSRTINLDDLEQDLII